MSSLTGADLFGLLLVLPWGFYMLWLINRGLHSEGSVGALVTVWPRAHPKEFCLWLALSLVVIGLFLLAYLGSATNTLAHRHQTAPGKFLSYHGQHAVFRYSFMVQNRLYQGEDSSDQQDIEATQAGRPFVVYYDPLNPNTNGASEPRRRASLCRTQAAIFGALILGILAIVIRKLGSLLRAAAAMRATSP